MTNELRVILLLSQLEKQRWFVNAVSNMIQNTNSKITHIIVDKNDYSISNPNSSTLRSHLPLRIKKLYFWLTDPQMRAMHTINEELYQSLQKIPITSIDELNDVPVSTFKPISDNGRVSVPAETIDLITNEGDVVIQHNLGILTGDILTAPKYGVLSYHGGDIREYRGAPTGFWEYMNKEDEMGTTVQKLSEELDGGKIISYSDIDISDATTWGDVLIQIHSKNKCMLEKAINNLNSKDFEPESPDDLGTLYKKSESNGWRIKLNYLYTVIEKSLSD